jgi:hypothetical protein
MPNEIMNPFEPPKTLATAARPAVTAEDDFRARLRGDSRGKRLAGWFLLASAVVSLVALFAPGMEIRPLSLVLDVIVGVVLVRGYGRAASFAVFRGALGLVLAILQGFQGKPELLVLMVPYAAGLALLAAGNPGKARLIFGCVCFGLYLAFFAAAVALAFSGLA